MTPLFWGYYVNFVFEHISVHVNNNLGDICLSIVSIYLNLLKICIDIPNQMFDVWL